MIEDMIKFKQQQLQQLQRIKQHSAVTKSENKGKLQLRANELEQKNQQQQSSCSSKINSNIKGVVVVRRK